MATTIDEALELLSDTGPEYSRALSNHGPMLAEALISLDRADLVIPWLDRYKKRLGAMPPGRELISGQNYQSALGDISRFRDWQKFFQTELKQKPWAVVLNQWVDRLAPGYIAAAMHGVIRTGHAVRSLSRSGSYEVTNELSSGLAYWASRYQSLPEIETRLPVVSVSIYEALHSIKVLPQAQRERLGLITKEISAVERMAEFPDVINALVQNDRPDLTLTALTEGFAFMFAGNAESTDSVIALVHAFTGPYALRHMLPYLENRVAKRALKYAWQASAAIYARYGHGLESTSSEIEPAHSNSELVERAVFTHDEHAVKFVEACLAEQKVNPNPIYLTAATLACRLLS